MGTVAKPQEKATSGAQRRDEICWRCQNGVLWLPLEGKPVAVEPCQAGKGNIGIQGSLLGGADEAIRVTAGSWRLHMEHCPGPKSFSATAPRRKGER